MKLVISKIPYEFQHIQVSENSLRSLLIKQQYEINAYKGVQKLDSVEQWRSYGFWGKLKFYYVNNGLKQTIRYAIQKMIGRAK